jgi:hypothetical protein
MNRKVFCKLLVIVAYTGMFSTIGQCYFSPAIMAQQPLVGQGLLWTSDQPDAETSDNTQHSQPTDHAPAGLVPAILAS